MSLVGGKFDEFSTHLGHWKGLPERPQKWPYRTFIRRDSQLYYLQSRYYDPELCRFLNADSLFDTNAGLAGYNLFTYCANSPVLFKDASGLAVDVALDVVSVLFSLRDLIKDRSLLNLGYLLWDVGSAFIPFIPGSYIAKGGKIVCFIAGKIDNFTEATEFLTGSYKNLKKLFKGIDGVEIHHLI